jgi:hypothetical protein
LIADADGVHSAMMVRPIVLGLLLAGCGANVVFAEDDAEEGGSPPSGECVLGVCGEECTKCEGTECFTGQCTEEGQCEPSGTVTCAE